jgi:hypothetical protein
MIDLHQQVDPYNFELPYGLSVRVKPLTTVGMAAAQAAARRSVEAIERQGREHAEAGFPLNGLPDLGGRTDGFYQAQLIRELAVRHITDWTASSLGAAPPRRRPQISLRSWSSTRSASGFFRSSRCAKWC